jgi:tryptophan synthase beta chain
MLPATGLTTKEPTVSEHTKILLDESEIPRRWYNLIPDLPAPPLPVLHPVTRGNRRRR